MASTTSTWQTVNFHFKVQFSFDMSDASIDIHFQSVTGMDSTMETEPLKEGGENLFTHVLPLRRKFGPLVLKRGLLMPGDSCLTDKLKAAFQNDTFCVFSMVMIELLDENHNSMVHWRIDNVWPLSWKIGELNAMEGAVLIETMELNYNHLVYTKLNS
jgi:phage tail-like protein